MKRYMFLLTLAQWSIARILEDPIPVMGFDDETVPALRKAYSELNVARKCGETDFVPTSCNCPTQLTHTQMAALERWIPESKPRVIGRVP